MFVFADICLYEVVDDTADTGIRGFFDNENPAVFLDAFLECLACGGIKYEPRTMQELKNLEDFVLKQIGETDRNNLPKFIVGIELFETNPNLG